MYSRPDYPCFAKGIFAKVHQLSIYAKFVPWKSMKIRDLKNDKSILCIYQQVILNLQFNDALPPLFHYSIQGLYIQCRCCFPVIVLHDRMHHCTGLQSQLNSSCWLWLPDICMLLHCTALHYSGKFSIFKDWQSMKFCKNSLHESRSVVTCTVH